MSTSVYFSRGTQSEQWLYEDLLIEAIQIRGHEVFYLPRTLVNEDDLFGEDTLSKFSDAYSIEMWMENNEGFDGDKEILTRFGLEVRNEVTFVIARRRWEDTIASDDNLIINTRPNEGDLIWHPTIQQMYEISFVDHDDPFYQIKNLPVYKLYCRTYEYSSEVFDTDVSAIDAIEDTESTDVYFYQISGEQSASTTYNQNVGLEDGTGSVDLETATDTGLLVAENETGFSSVLVENSDSLNSFFIISESYSIQTIDPSSDNEFIGTQMSTVLNFTEVNPFGEPTEGSF